MSNAKSKKSSPESKKYQSSDKKRNFSLTHGIRLNF